MFQDDNKHYVTSMLSSNTIRWINKKQSNNSNSVKAYLFPPQALQIYEMLNRMEGEFAGNERIAELYEVVKFVVEFYNLEWNLRKQVKKEGEEAELDFLNGYVGSDQSGGIEFAEYLALNYDKCEIGVSVMNSEGELVSKKGDVQELNMRKLRLHAAFDELCNFIRRKRIDQKIKENSLADIDKYNSMVELFGINYFKTNSFENSMAKQNIERIKKYPNLVIEKTGMRNYKKEGSIQLRKQRVSEIGRARHAATHLDHLAEERKDPKINEKILKFWEDKGELLPLRAKK